MRSLSSKSCAIDGSSRFRTTMLLNWSPFRGLRRGGWERGLQWLSGLSGLIDLQHLQQRGAHIQLIIIGRIALAEDIKQAGANLLVQLIEFYALLVAKVRIVDLVNGEAYAICSKIGGIKWIAARDMEICRREQYLQLTVSPSPEPASASYSSYRCWRFDSFRFVGDLRSLPLKRRVSSRRTRRTPWLNQPSSTSGAFCASSRLRWDLLTAAGSVSSSRSKNSLSLSSRLEIFCKGKQ